MGSLERLRTLFDGPWTEYDSGLMSTDPLQFTDTKPYAERLKASIEATGMKDAVVTASGRIDGYEVIVAAMDTGSSAGAWAWWSARRSRAAIERALSSPPPGHHRFLLGRRAHDGRRPVPDADGENLLGAGAARSGAHSVYFAAHRSDHRRCDRAVSPCLAI